MNEREREERVEREREREGGRGREERVERGERRWGGIGSPIRDYNIATLTLDFCVDHPYRPVEVGKKRQGVSDDAIAWSKVAQAGHNLVNDG